MSQLLDDAADALERRLFFEQLNTGYAALRDDPDAWSAVEAERAAESSALRDHDVRGALRLR
ncbi:MAG TPA: hypothetical protein VHU13_01505 [Solirubrobacteraceae bacterium]|jgi:hypothetical protein|nr:hypothetical protein [Solirubrobacteraceae bacterium]